MESLELKLNDGSRLELNRVHHNLLSINRWVPGSEFSTAEWLLSGSALLGGADLEQLLTWLSAAGSE